jgi:hypothetical protein
VQVFEFADAKAFLTVHSIFHMENFGFDSPSPRKEPELDISNEAIDQMRAHLTVQDDEFEVISIEEKRRRFVGA